MESVRAPPLSPAQLGTPLKPALDPSPNKTAVPLVALTDTTAAAASKTSSSTPKQAAALSMVSSHQPYHHSNRKPSHHQTNKDPYSVPQGNQYEGYNSGKSHETTGATSPNYSTPTTAVQSPSSSATPQPPLVQTAMPATPVAGTAASVPIPPPSRRLTRIGPYKLGRTLGVGSTGRVKLGTHIRTSEKVAIKILPKSSRSLAEQRKLEREITIMKLINHPHVLQLYDVYETDKELFLILEHVEGGELFDYLVRMGRLQESEARKCFQQIIAGLQFCHKHHICHRDLKPENLLLDSKMNIKVADFGMASFQRPSMLLKTSCGSPHYASPEIIKGIQYDGASADIWSCGVILYALVSGNLPFDDDNIRRLLNKVKNGAFQMPRDVSPEVQDLLRQMMTVDPAERITMEGIMEHPWFKVRVFRQVEFELQVRSFGRALTEDQIDAEIFKSLVLLGWEDEAALKHALMREGENTEKVFYMLLARRKQECMNLDMSDSDLCGVDPSIPKRRNESFVSLTGMSTTDLNLSMPSPPAPTVKSTVNLHQGASIVESPTGVGPRHERSYTKSTPDLSKRPKGLTINIPKFSRNDVRPLGGAEAGKTKSKNDIPPTPMFTTTPKRSWFATIFHFKPELFQFPSNRPTGEALGFIRTELMAIGGKLSDIKKAGFKCRCYDDTLKIRVEVQQTPAAIALHDVPNTPGTSSQQMATPPVSTVRISLHHGSSQVFQRLCHDLKGNWMKATSNMAVT